MKQNERLLVYAVTGFLAIILVVAVLFGPSGRDAAAKVGTVDPTVGAAGAAPTAGAGTSTPSGAPGLGEILRQKPAPAGGPAVPGGAANPAAGGPEAGGPTTTTVDPQVRSSHAGLGSVDDVLPAIDSAAQQPLVATQRPLLVVDLLAQQLGPSRRDRTVRLVRARPGDSLETLVRRWCGARDPFLEEARSLNEDLVVLRNGQEVCVPWVDDETVLAAYEASRPKMLIPEAASSGTVVAPTVPSFAQPGERRGDASSAPATSSMANSSYTVKDGDSLWRIADRTYGRKNAARMIGEIRKQNPGLGETLRVGQKIVLPAAPTGGA